MDKYFNSAIIGNKDLVASFSEEGELLRFNYPNADGRQFIDYFRTGVKINDSNLIYLHEDVNNRYKQRYINDTNILVTNISNSYYNLEIEQIDCAIIDKNILLRKYIFKNNNRIDLDVDFIVNSKILSNQLENFGSKIFEYGVTQYNHDYSFTICSNTNLKSHKLNDVDKNIESGTFCDKDYIGMSNEIAVAFNVGTLKPKEKKELCVYICIEKTSKDKNDFSKIVKLDSGEELDKTANYWIEYVKEHKKVKFKGNDEYTNKILEIYTRTILLYPLLINYTTGGIAAALEVDEKREKSGAYSYCWTRDAIFITKAFNLLGMEEESAKFYNDFCQSTQSPNGMWEQRFYTDKTLAPCWGYQIDETASVVYGVYDYYMFCKDKTFVEKNIKMCENAIKFLFEYVENVLQIDEDDFVKKSIEEKNKKYFEIQRHVSYDLWEMNEGVHVYSLASIISAFKCMEKLYELINTEDKTGKLRLKAEKQEKIIKKMNTYSNLLKKYIEDELVDKKYYTLKRNTNDSKMDISVMGTVYPFEIFNANEKIIKNTVDKINMTLRTYTGAYLRFENDSYMGGKNPWIITTLWMALYYLKIDNIEEAEKCFEYVVSTACKHGFLAEQVNNEDIDFKWVIGLGWSHAMFVIVLNEILRRKKK